MSRNNARESAKEQARVRIRNEGYDSGHVPEMFRERPFYITTGSGYVSEHALVESERNPGQTVSRLLRTSRSAIAPR